MALFHLRHKILAKQGQRRTLRSAASRPLWTMKLLNTFPMEASTAVAQWSSARLSRVPKGPSGGLSKRLRFCSISAISLASNWPCPWGANMLTGLPAIWKRTCMNFSCCGIASERKKSRQCSMQQSCSLLSAAVNKLFMRSTAYQKRWQLAWGCPMWSANFRQQAQLWLLTEYILNWHRRILHSLQGSLWVCKRERSSSLIFKSLHNVE